MESWKYLGLEQMSKPNIFRKGFIVGRKTFHYPLLSNVVQILTFFLYEGVFVGVNYGIYERDFILD